MQMIFVLLSKDFLGFYEHPLSKRPLRVPSIPWHINIIVSTSPPLVIMPAIANAIFYLHNWPDTTFLPPD